MKNSRQNDHEIGQVMYGDRNCLRAIAFILYDRKMVHKKMQQLLARFIQLNRADNT